MSGAAERRSKILKILCRRRKETIRNLACELGVSERTIQRDIETLSITEPIYTQSGRYKGGVYINSEFSMYRMYMTGEEIRVLQKAADLAAQSKLCGLTDREIDILNSIIKTYTKPDNPSITV